MCERTDEFACRPQINHEQHFATMNGRSTCRKRNLISFLYTVYTIYTHAAAVAAVVSHAFNLATALAVILLAGY